MAKTKPKRSLVPVITWAFIALTLVVGVVIARSAKHKERAAAVGQVNQPVSVSGNPLEKLPESGADPAVGVKAPELRGAGFDGSPVTIGAVSEKRTLIAFVAHWCPHCNREVPRIITWWGSSARPSDLNLVAVSTAVDKSLPHYPPSTWLQDEHWTEPVMADSVAQEAASAYGLTGS